MSQRDRRGLIEFIQKRGGAVYERDIMQSFWRLKNDKERTERELSALCKAGTGKWEPVRSRRRKRPTDTQIPTATDIYIYTNRGF
jgi:hypothetical protein